MNMTTTPKLPPNPYKRSPIKKREDLAGRAREQKAIRYYLNLTASGQSPHLALIGQRGIGKTSLLNGAECIAKDLKLLPVRLDMNELKANSPGRFWHDLYQTLALSMAKAGCWGGEQGTIYAELLRMLHARQPGSLEKAVMQIPYVFSCYQGDIDRFECPDALVVNDFENCLTELQSKGFSGIVLLIDEADCLGKNVPLLQMFRNIFQIVEHCSLLLAGTEAVFPVLSEVFSPIPRQFYRIDVKPFASWSDTRDLVLRPISKNISSAIAPKYEMLEELHELCGGAPDEVQLYCHHMYRSVEEGSSRRMNLSPHVFREVLREYRSNTPANVDTVLNAIERLPDKLLYESKWVSRRALTLEENIRVSILRRELQSDKKLSTDERTQIVIKITEGYNQLFEKGIIENNNCIQLIGAPLTSGFWKSFVNVEREKRWSWNDDSFADNLHKTIINKIGRIWAIGVVYNIGGKDAVTALRVIREGKTHPEFDDGMNEMIVSALFAQESKSTHAVDITFQIISPAGKHLFQSRFFEKDNQHIEQGKIQEWIDNCNDILAGNELSIAITAFDRWALPAADELHRLGYISGYRIPDVFGPTQTEKAIAKFKAGDISGCADDFSRMLADKEDSTIRNNLAFCQILMEQFSPALENASNAILKDYEPLFELNKGIAEFLQGNTGHSKKSLRNAFDQLRASESKFDSTADLVLVLESGATKVGFHADLPVDTAILINLWRMGDLTRAELETDLTRLYPEKAQTWLSTFADP